ncbi:MAG: hypothetical protein RL154_615 [Pseudomonadota bacterium]|jgi:hypothetical protein
MQEDLDVVQEYAASERKKDTMWMVFNTVYNNVHAFSMEEKDNYLNPAMTDSNARSEFFQFMKTNYLDVGLVKVLDLVTTEYLELPYLGSIAIDADIGSDVYNALVEKYGDPTKEPNSNNAVLWVIEYKDALDAWKRREGAIDDI